MQWITDSINSLFVTPSTPPGGPLQKTGNLTKEQVRKFFEAGYTMFDNEGVKEQLKEAARKRQNVGWLITEMQKQIFESQGVDGKFGVGFLGKIRELYGDDSKMLEELMKFVEREEIALDEAELPTDQLIQKLEMKEWSMGQYGNMQTQMRQMTPEQQLQFMKEQQTAMRVIQEEQKGIIAKAETLSPEEKQAYIKEQVQKLQARFSLGNPGREDGNQGQGCPGCDSCPQGAAPKTMPSMGSVMSSDEQLQFFKSLNNGHGRG